MRKKNLLFLILIMLNFAFVLPSHGSDVPTKKQALQFVWDFVVRSDQKATTEDLQNIASYLKEAKIDEGKIKTAMKDKGLSQRQLSDSLHKTLKVAHLYQASLILKTGRRIDGIFVSRSGLIRPRMEDGSTSERTLDDIVDITLNQ